MAYKFKKYEFEKPHENKVVPPTSVETAGPETINGTLINSLFVNVRKEPNLESEVVEVLRKGDNVAIFGKIGKFYKVLTNSNRIAYILSDFIKEE